METAAAEYQEMTMLNTNELPVGSIHFSVSEGEWFAAGADDSGEVYGDRDFRPIADCATLDEAKQAILQADHVRGRIYIDEMVRCERSATGSPIFVGYKSELQASLRIPVQSAGSGNTIRARQAG
jgi:hypothetical protein